MSQRSEELKTLLVDCEVRNNKLTEWEISFIIDARKMLTRDGNLDAFSRKQEDKLNEIWDRIT
jgi:hypothetical protein